MLFEDGVEELPGALEIAPPECPHGTLEQASACWWRRSGACARAGFDTTLVFVTVAGPFECSPRKIPRVGRGRQRDVARVR